MSDDQSRLQEYDVNVGAPPVEDRPTCERCGDDLDDVDDARRRHRTRSEKQLGVTDVRRGPPDRLLCDECFPIFKYLFERYNELTAVPGVVGAVAVFCECQDWDEIDVRPVRRGDTTADIFCSNCGSCEVVIEELPPGAESYDVTEYGHGEEL